MLVAPVPPADWDGIEVKTGPRGLSPGGGLASGRLVDLAGSPHDRGSAADPAHHEGLALSGGMLVAIGSFVRSTGLSVEYGGQSRVGWHVEEASVIVQQLRANTFALTVTGPELSGLIAAARLALDFVSQDPAAPAEARELLARLLRDYEQAMAPESGNGGH